MAMNRHVPADERAPIARARPNAFDVLRDTGKLGVGMWTKPVDVKTLAYLRWTTGEMLRQLHACGWINRGGDAANPLDSPEAVAARARLAEIEAAIGLASWPLVLRVVIAGDSLRQCHDLLEVVPDYYQNHTDSLLLDRLCMLLDRIAPLLS